MTRARLIGSAVKRVEDPRLVTGAGTYIGDLSPVGVLHAAFVRSSHASARITGIDTQAAKAAVGVQAVLTGADVNHRFAALPGASGIEGANNPGRTILADGSVRFVGEADRGRGRRLGSSRSRRCRACRRQLRPATIRRRSRSSRQGRRAAGPRVARHQHLLPPEDPPR